MLDDQHNGVPDHWGHVQHRIATALLGVVANMWVMVPCYNVIQKLAVEAVVSHVVQQVFTCARQLAWRSIHVCKWHLLFVCEAMLEALECFIIAHHTSKYSSICMLWVPPISGVPLMI